MKKINPRLQFLRFAAALAFVLMVFISSSTTTTLAAAAEAEEEVGSCNATRIADCLADDEEFLMESETTRRILYGGKPIPPVTPLSQIPKKPFCDSNVHASCTPRPNKFYDKRPCGYAQTCRTNA